MPALLLTSFFCLLCAIPVARAGEAEGELLNLVSHEEATPEACLAGLQAALAAPGGAPLARAALSLVLERFADEPGLAVELVRVALVQAEAGTSAGVPGQQDGSDSDAGESAAAAAEALALEVVGDDRLLEAVCEEPGLRRHLTARLWNHALARLHGGPGGCEAALAFFSAALPLLGGGGGGATQAEGEGGKGGEGSLAPAECRRAQALCCAGMGQFDRWAGGALGLK